MKKKGGITASKERKRQEREGAEVAVLRNASRNPLARRSTRSRGLLERNRAELVNCHSGATSTCSSLHFKLGLPRTRDRTYAQASQWCHV